jgi:hypothetical protein
MILVLWNLEELPHILLQALVLECLQEILLPLLVKVILAEVS